MTNKNLRDKAKACNSNIQELINKLTDIQKDISDYVNKSNAIDALDALNMPINPMIAFQLIQIHIKILCDSMAMGEHLDNVVNSLQTVTNAFNKDMFGDDNKHANLNDIPKEAGVIKGKFGDVESFLTDVEAIMKMMEEEEEGDDNE